MGDKEVKLVSADFDTSASNLAEDKGVLDSTKDTLSTTNDNLKSDWLGDGGNAFIATAKSIEEEFKARISELEGEINDLQVAKITISALDTQLADKLENAIDGTSESNNKTMSI